MTKQEFKKWIAVRPSYTKWSFNKLSEATGLSIEQVKSIVNPLRKQYEAKGSNIEIKPIKQENKLKRLFFDIETSPNVVFSWNVGAKQFIDYNSILKERAIICICWKWEGESKVNYLFWNDGDDSTMIKEFAKVINSAHEVCGHNSENFDIKWFRTRCIYHGIKSLPEFVSIDTLKIARKYFRFNSNKLDYIGKYLKFGGKSDPGGISTWKKIVLDNDQQALIRMIDYCKRDVIQLEKIYQKMQGYSKAKTHVGVLKGNNKRSCPSCGNDNCIKRGYRTTSTGIRKIILQCTNNMCLKYHTVSESVFNK